MDCFANNRERMRYKVFRNRSFFIGSGDVEAACKTMVAQRFKGSGMDWSAQGLSHLLSIRSVLLSRRYEEFRRTHSSLPAAA